MTAELPTVTVLMPLLNGEPHLAEARQHCAASPVHPSRSWCSTGGRPMGPANVSGTRQAPRSSIRLEGGCIPP